MWSLQVEARHLGRPSRGNGHVGDRRTWRRLSVDVLGGVPGVWSLVVRGEHLHGADRHQGECGDRQGDAKSSLREGEKAAEEQERVRHADRQVPCQQKAGVGSKAVRQQHEEGDKCQENEQASAASEPRPEPNPASDYPPEDDEQCPGHQVPKQSSTARPGRSRNGTNGWATSALGPSSATFEKVSGTAAAIRRASSALFSA